MAKTKTRDAIRAARVIKTAEIVGGTTNYVNKVLACERDSEEVMVVYMSLQEGENKLLESVKKLIPFN